MSNLSWDSAIEHEGASFALLPPGIVRFEVTKFEAGTSSGEKTKGAPKAMLELKLKSATGYTGLARETMVLHTSTMWKIAEFFCSIGQLKQGESKKPNWKQVLGSSGECEITIEKWTKQDGTEGESNRVKRFLAPVDKPVKPKTDDDEGLPF